MFRRIAVLLLLAAVAAGCGTQTPADTAPVGTQVRQGLGSQDASADVKMVSFEEDEFDTSTGVLEVINHSGKTSDYVIEMAVEDSAGTLIDSPAAVVMGLAPGKKARTEFLTIQKQAAKATIAEVSRTASG